MQKCTKNERIRKKDKYTNGLKGKVQKMTLCLGELAWGWERNLGQVIKFLKKKNQSYLEFL